MSWAYTNGGWIHSGTTLDVWVFDTQMTGTGSLVVGVVGLALPVGVFIYASPLADTRYQVIVDGSNIELNKFVYGTVTGASPLATAAHGMTDPLATYTLEVRWVNGVISVFLNGATTALFTYDASADPDTRFTSMGFDSIEDGARVGSAKLYLLTQTFAALADVAWWVANGSLYASDTGELGGRLIGTFFDPDARVVGAEILQHAIIEDGTHVVEFDAALMTAAPIVNTAGKMPGQTALNTAPGFSTSKFVLAYNDRVGYLQDQYAIFSKLGDRHDLDLTTDLIGKAFVWPSQVGEPLLGAFVASENRMLMWGRRSIWSMTGDPALGAQVTELSPTIGGSGPFSAAKVEKGIVLIHGDQGLIGIPPGGDPEPLSRDILTDVIQVDNAADTLYVSIVQDIKNHGIWIFLTPVDGSAGRHIFYDERTGRYNPQGGGFWPQSFGDVDDEPTCAMLYRGDVVFGTRTGKMLCFDKAIQGTDNGTDFASKLMLQAVHTGDTERGILIRDFGLIMGLNSGSTTLTLLGGDTPERAFGSEAWTLWSGTMGYTRDTFSPSASAPAVVLQITATGEAWSLEKVDVDFQPTTLLPEKKKPALTYGTVCQPPVPSTPDSDPDNDPGPGPGDPPDPGTCTACATWMAENTTGVVDGEDAYRLAGPNVLAGAQDEVTAALSTLLAQNICDIGTDPTLWVSNITDPDDLWTNQAMLSSVFLALTNADIPPSLVEGQPNGKGWMVHFRCADIP